MTSLGFILVQLIKKGGLRERANRSSKYSQSENNIKTLDPHRYNNQLQDAEMQTLVANSNDKKSQKTKPD